VSGRAILPGRLLCLTTTRKAGRISLGGMSPA
jgi:hypothetical protein